jgi:uncharacterized protein (TIGR03000 family)
MCYGCGCYGGGYYGGWGMQNYGFGYGNMAPPAAYAMYGNYPPYVAYSAYGSQIYMGCVGGIGGCYGCYGGWSCYGAPILVTPSTPPAKKYIVPDEGIVPPKEEKKMDLDKKEDKKIDLEKNDKKIDLDKKEDEKGDGKKVGLQVKNDVMGNWATIVVNVPADAKVFIDGKQMKSKSARRVFQSPMLEEGGTYFYDIRAEVVRDGKTISENRRVILRPGQRIAANFDNIGNSAAAAVAKGDDEK